jgi:hypothetical protein
MALTLMFTPPGRGPKPPNLSADAGVPAHCYEPGRGKKSGIRCEETGKRFGKTNVSAKAPEFFHQAVLANQDYFEKRGQIEKITLNRDDPNNTKPRGAGKTSAERERAAVMFCGAKRHDIVNEVTGEVNGQTVCSAMSPRQFHTALENNRPFYASHISDSQMKVMTTNQGPKSFAKTKKKVMNEETGQVLSNALTSPTSPEWMKTVIAENRSFYDHPPKYFQPDEFAEFPVGKKTVFTTTEKGEPCNIYVLSKDSPTWMRSPLLSNKKYFEKAAQGEFQECQLKYKNPWIGKRQHFPDPDTGVVSHRGNMCSHEDVPDWMMSALTPKSPKSPTKDKTVLRQQRRSDPQKNPVSPTSSNANASGRSSCRSGRANPDGRAARGAETERFSARASERVRTSQTQRAQRGSSQLHGAETERGRARR